MEIDKKDLGNKVSNKKGDGLDKHLLEIRNLRTYFFTDVGVLKTLDGIDLCVKKKETLGLVGESGCGKTMTARSIMRLVPHPGRIVDGEIILNGRNLLSLSENEMRKIRGDAISMVFQEPMTSLNPVYQIGNQITETLAVHRPAITRK
ncbi:MAG: ATP-binding cassette domain-containing protein [Ignavibacteria bacterium]|nr:ATP-binding cassette domain-containing protein [Ignavibacteria bacterium]